VTDFGINAKGARRITEESNLALHQSMLRCGDLVTVRVGYPGTTAVVPPELDRCNCASMMIIRKPRKCRPEWLCYVMNSPVGRSQVDVVEYGAAQKQFNIGHAVEFRIPIPPPEEQTQIVGYLDRERTRLATLEGKVLNSIGFLREYRTALISAAVTGQIDVRGEVM
jgi:type I restriction enzyme S subunit